MQRSGEVPRRTWQQDVIIMTTKKKSKNTTGVPLNDGSGAGVCNAGRGGCTTPTKTRKG